MHKVTIYLRYAYQSPTITGLTVLFFLTISRLYTLPTTYAKFEQQLDKSVQTDTFLARSVSFFVNFTNFAS